MYCTYIGLRSRRGLDMAPSYQGHKAAVNLAQGNLGSHSHDVSGAELSTRPKAECFVIQENRRRILRTVSLMEISGLHAMRVHIVRGCPSRGILSRLTSCLEAREPHSRGIHTQRYVDPRRWKQHLDIRRNRLDRVMKLEPQPGEWCPGARACCGVCQRTGPKQKEGECCEVRNGHRGLCEHK